MKPIPARWFEAIAARDDLSRLVDALARSGLVEIECESSEAQANGVDVGVLLDEYAGLARRYQPYWPTAAEASAGRSGAPLVVLGAGLDQLRAWSHEADPLIGELEGLSRQHSDLELLNELLEATGKDFPDLHHVLSVGPTLAARLWAVPLAAVKSIDAPVIEHRVLGPAHGFLLLVGTSDAIASVEASLEDSKARRIEIPEDVAGPAPIALQRIRRRLDDIARRRDELEDQVAKLSAQYELGDALADFRRLQWFVKTVPPLPHTQQFAIVTGWTSDARGAQLREVVKRSGIDALVHFPPAPAGRAPPIVLYNPAWIRPFESFAQMLGTPSQHEADPSVLLMIIAPLLFGYMFGDVGQGAVLVLSGLVLSRKLPAARLLIYGGLASIGFGVLYGAVFTREDLIGALWLHPFNEPLTLLAASVVGGAIILVVGLLVSGVEARWRCAMGRWLATDAALLVLYLGLLGLLVHPASSLVVLLAIAWFVVGSAASAPSRRFTAALASVGHLVERTLQLLVNTVSFARVGAFALAHAGLSTAVASLSESTDHPASMLAVLIVGNAFIIVLEGLVVSIQTTRLVLFEFFVRFLRGEGRAFRPLLPPPSFGPPQGVQNG